MIEAIELRIGNMVNVRYIFEPFLKNKKVESVGEEGINLNIGSVFEPYMQAEHEFNQLEGIPLTEEWLVKFGFEKTITDCTWGNGKKALFFDDGFCDFVGAKIQHVHQLQNLYFALTGEELTIKN